MKKNKKKGITSFEKGVTHPEKNYTQPIGRKRSRRLIILGILISLLIFLVSSLRTKSSPEKEAKAIVKRAIELLKYIPNEGEKLTLTEALTKLSIHDFSHLGPEDELQLPKDKFILIILSDEKISGKGSDLISVMAFDPDHFSKTGQVVVTMNSRIGTLSDDMDIKAAGLIHELFHGIQVGLHNLNRDKVTNAMVFNDERIAWSSQAFLYKAVRPDMFEEIHVDCQTFHAHSSNKEKAKILKKDKLVSQLMMYVYCGDTFLKTLYREK